MSKRPRRTIRLLDAEGKIRPYDELEREIIDLAVVHSRGNMSAAAAALGIGRMTLYRKTPHLREDRSRTS